MLTSLEMLWLCFTDCTTNEQQCLPISSSKVWNTELHCVTCQCCGDAYDRHMRKVHGDDTLGLDVYETFVALIIMTFGGGLLAEGLPAHL